MTTDEKLYAFAYPSTRQKVAYVPLKPIPGWRAVDTRLPITLADNAEQVKREWGLE